MSPPNSINFALGILLVQHNFGSKGSVHPTILPSSTQRHCISDSLIGASDQGT